MRGKQAVEAARELLEIQQTSLRLSTFVVYLFLLGCAGERHALGPCV